MARTHWRDQIDLTNDSDDNGPLSFLISPPKPKKTPIPLPENVRHLYEPTPASRPKQSRVPLPENVRHIYESTPTSQPKQSRVPLPENLRHLAQTSSSKRHSPASSKKPSPSATTSASSSKSASVKGSRSSTANGQHNGTPYVPVFSTAHKGSTNGSSVKPQAEKRRKLSVSNKQASTIPHSRKTTTSDQQAGHGYSIDTDGFGVHRAGSNVAQPGVPNINARRKLERMNKGPTVHSLNSLLKSSSVRPVPLSAAMLESEPRALHIGRMPMDERDDLEHYNSELTLPRASSKPSFSRPPIRTRIASEPEEMELDQDTNQTVGTFRPRISPLKGPSNPTSTRPGSFSGSVNSPAHEERDSSLLVSLDYEGAGDYEEPPHFAPIDTTLKEDGKKIPKKFTEEEEHLLIFLKEVKGLQWREITPYFPDRSIFSLQTRYSIKLNKRDRSLDPPRLKLPTQFATESLTDWTTVHHDIPAPLSTTKLTEEAAAFNEPSHRRTRVSTGRQILDSHPHNDYSSANDSVLHKSRPKRSVQQVNYTWPRRNGTLHVADDSAEEDSVLPISRSMSIPFRSSEPSEEPSLGPETVIPVDKPMNMDFDQNDAALGISAVQARRRATAGQKLPYLAFVQRLITRECPKNGEWDQLCAREWQGSVLHVDFSPEEVEIAEQAIIKMINPSQLSRQSSHRKRLQRLLQDQSEPKLLKLSYEIQRRLHTRDRESIDAFLQDAKIGRLRDTPHIERMGAVRPNRKFSSHPKASTSSLIRQRELGLESRRGWKQASRPLSYQMRNKIQDSLGPAYSFTGASSDVHTVAWHPDGQCFAAGAVSVTDPDSMQYNRPNNLLYGDISEKVIHELAEHFVERERQVSGPNSTHAMFVTQDPKLYTTVSSVAFSPNGKYMYSAGYDEVACIWEASQDGLQPELLGAMKHTAGVDILTVSRDGILATGAKKWEERAVKVIIVDDQNPNCISKQSYTSKKAIERPDLKILPTALQFEPHYGRLLLAGFGANTRENRLDTNGDICLWDVETAQQLGVHGSGKNVFDVAFNPNQRVQPFYVVGCVAGQNVNRGTRSTLRFYDGYGSGKYSMMMEIECPALDMNDVVFCPYDENIVAAGCTSGRTYVWDVRRPDTFLYHLSHGKSLMPLDDFTDREVSDTGVRFLSWGSNATRLYTGSSDGVVKVWDVVRSPEDVFIKDLITVDSGIMSGAFSPDKSKLIVGEVNGSINVLEVGKDDLSVKDTEKLRYLSYDDDDDDSNTEATPDADLGNAIASQLLATGKMISRPVGGLPIRQAVQGPDYDGPFDDSIDAPFLREQALEFQLNMAITPGPQCNISSCRDTIIKVTSEETGDSGRSTDRIPDELRKQWKMVGSDLTVNYGKSQCSNCGRPARPSEVGATVAETLRCERCSFACFRCGAINKIHPEMDLLVCGGCERVWDIGALGYECVKEVKKTGSETAFSNVPLLRRFKKDLQVDMGLEHDTVFGDEMNALTDYYHSLAIDRPESPPL